MAGRGRAACAAAARTRLRQRAPGRDPQLFRDEVEIRDELRDAVLDLEPRVDLEEPEPPIGVEQELRRRGVVQPGGARGPDGEVVELGALVGRQARRRRFLDELLVPALDRAVALPQRDDRAVCVAEQLHLDVARRPDLALQVDRAIAECGQRLRRSGRQRGRQVLGATSTRRMPRPPPPAAALTSNGKPTASAAATTAAASSGRSTAAGSNVPGTTGTPASSRRPARRELVAEGGDRVGRRADEGEPGVDHRPRERRALRQEAVAGVDRLGARRERRLDDRVGAQVALRRRRRTQPHRGVGRPDMGRIGVGVGVDRDGLDAQLATGADDAEGDLAAVGDEDPRERRRPTVFAQRRGRAPPSARARSQRDVAVLLRRVRVALVGQHLQRGDEPRPRLATAG